MSTKEKLIEAYLNIIQEQGPSAISVKNITSTVGITKSSMYCHFESLEALEDGVIDFCLNQINKAEFVINYKSDNAEELFVQLINSFIDTFSQFPTSAFLILIESNKLTNDKFAQLSSRLDLMICARLTVALDYCVQRSWTDIDDTDTYAQILTPFIKNLLTSDQDLEDCIHAILSIL